MKKQIWQLLLFPYVFLIIFLVLVYQRRYIEEPPNLQPFASIISWLNLAQQHDGELGTAKFVLMNLLGNILLFLPLGFFYARTFSFVARWQSISLALIFCMLLESAQFIFHKGVLDIDDVILNMLGIYIGLLLAKAKN